LEYENIGRQTDFNRIIGKYDIRQASTASPRD